MASRYAFLVDTYATEILKVLSVWAMTDEADLDVRPRTGDRRGRTLREHMVHQCQSEHGWFVNMFDIAVTLDALPAERTRLAFLQHYADAAGQRQRALAAKGDEWWQSDAAFFEVRRPRTWIMTRRIAHTAHHRGQQTAMLRMLGRDLHSTYGPSADTGGLPKDGPAVVYPYDDIASLLAAEAGGGDKRALPPAAERALTELPDA